MSDIISGVNVRISLYQNVVADGDGEYPGESIDTSDPMARLSVVAFLLTLSNGEYSLSWEDSDDELTWDPVDSSKVIGSGVATDVPGDAAYPGIGVFDTRRYLRPVVTASGVPSATLSAPLASLVHVGNTATGTFVSTQGLLENDDVTISGATPAEYNGTFTAINVVGDSFDYDIGSDPGADATGTILAQIPVHPTPTGAVLFLITKQQTEAFGDMDSDTKIKTLGFASINSDGDSNLTSHYVGDWEGGIGFALLAGGLVDGTYTLKIDESDDDGVEDPWTEVDPSKILVGDAVIDYDCASPVALPTSGVFGTKNYIRPRLVATNVTTGVFAIFLLGILASDILPTDSI